MAIFQCGPVAVKTARKIMMDMDLRGKKKLDRRERAGKIGGSESFKDGADCVKIVGNFPQ